MRICFVHQGKTSFVEKDLNILRRNNQVREIAYKGMFSLPSLIGCVLWSDMTFSWFGSIHAFFTVFFSRAFGRKSVVIAGGYDVGQSDGLWRDPFKKWCPKYVFGKADTIITVSEFNRNEAIQNLKIRPERLINVYHGFDSNIFSKLKNVNKENTVITVSQVSKYNRKRKGLDLFIETAKLLPGHRFVLVGEWIDGTIDQLKKSASANVEFTGKLSHEELIKFYSISKVYVQISNHEAFGCAIAESMLCECLPVVSKVAAIPEVVGECGVYVQNNMPEEIAKKIKQACEQEKITGAKARARIISLFPLEKRAEQLLGIVERTMSDKAKLPSELYDRKGYEQSGGVSGLQIIKASKGNKFPPYYEERLQRAGINPGMRVLDFGCGRGEFVIWSAISGADAVGIDYSRDAIDLSNELVSSLDRQDNSFKQRLKFIKSDGKTLPFPDKSFDRIVSFAVLEHIHDWEIREMLAECKRLLKEDGQIYMETHPNLWYLKYIFPIVALVKNNMPFRNKNVERAWYGAGDLHVNEQSVVSLRRNLKKAGFRGKVGILPRNHLNIKSFEERYRMLAWALFPVALMIDRYPPFNYFFGLTVYTKAAPRHE